jgi:hypothetical protein
MRASSSPRFSSNDSLPKSIETVHSFSLMMLLTTLKNELYFGILEMAHEPMLKLNVTATRTLGTIAFVGIVRERIVTGATNAYVPIQIVNFALHDLPFLFF